MFHSYHPPTSGHHVGLAEHGVLLSGGVDQGKLRQRWLVKHYTHMQPTRTTGTKGQSGVLDKVFPTINPLNEGLTVIGYKATRSNTERTEGII